MRVGGGIHRGILRERAADTRIGIPGGLGTMAGSPARPRIARDDLASTLVLASIGGPVDRAARKPVAAQRARMPQRAARLGFAIPDRHAQRLD
jgi:hypothetical protein